MTLEEIASGIYGLHTSVSVQWRDGETCLSIDRIHWRAHVFAHSKQPNSADRGAPLLMKMVMR